MKTIHNVMEIIKNPKKNLTGEAAISFFKWQNGNSTET